MINYVDITKGIVAGDGTEFYPYNYDQLVNYFNPDIITGDIVSVSATSGDVVKIKGSKFDGFLSATSTPEVFINCHGELVGSITIEGYDIDEYNGSPIVFNKSEHFALFDLEHSTNDSELNITLKNFIIDGPYSDRTDVSIVASMDDTHRKTNIDFKTVLFNTDYLRQFYQLVGLPLTSAFGSYKFYGTTLDVNDSVSTFNRLVGFEIYDSVVLTDLLELELTSVATIKSNNNLTSLSAFTNGIGSPGVSGDYEEPSYISGMSDYETKNDAINQIAYYKTKSFLRYDNFNIITSGSTSVFRETNEYDVGLFGYTRTSYGAYAFEESTADSNGTIGSYYFGGAVTNALISAVPPVIELVVSGFNVLEVTNKEFAVINIVVPENIAEGYKSFDLDFSASITSGGSPLLVEFHAYNYDAKGQYAGILEPYEFRWWFDYATSGGVNDYVTCATDKAEWLYCGFYGDTYDVRCCVMYV